MLDIRDNLRTNLKAKFVHFHLDDNIIEESIEHALNKSEIENNTYIKSATTYIERYIVDKMKKDEEITKKLKESLLQLKLRIVMNNRTATNIDKAFEDAVEKLPEYYDKKQSINSNVQSYILTHLTTKTNNSVKKSNVEERITIGKKIRKSETETIGIRYNEASGYKIDFLSEFFRNNKVLNNELSKILNLDISTIYQCITFGKKISNEKLNILLKHTNANTYEELVEKEKNGTLEFYKVEKEKVVIEKKVVVEKEKVKKTPKFTSFYDISFLKEYLTLMNITQEDFCMGAGLSTSGISNYLNGKKQVTKEKLDKILKYFEVDTYSELVTKVKNITLNKKTEKQNNGEEDAFTLLKEYFDLKHITQSSFCAETGISRSYLCSITNQKLKVNETTIKKIFDYFDVKTYSEFENKIKNAVINLRKRNNNILQENLDIHKTYDISFLKPYIIVKGILRTDITKHICKTNQFITNCLDNGELIDDTTLKLLLEYFKVNSYSELQLLVLKYFNIDTIENLKEYANDNIKESYNLDFLSEYIKALNIDKVQISNRIEMTPRAFNAVLRGTSNISYKNFEKLLKYFNVNNYTELLNMVLEYFKVKSLEEYNKLDFTEKEYKYQVIIGDTYDVSFLKKYLELKNILQIDFIEAIGISKSQVAALLSGNSRTTIDNLKKILKYFNVNSYEELVEKVNNETKIQVQIIKNNEYDISFIKPYLIVKNITKTEIKEKLNISSNLLLLYLNGEKFIDEKRLNLLLELLNISSYEDLQKEVLNEFSKENFEELDEFTSINIKETYDIRFIKKYLLALGISQVEISEKIGLLPKSFSRFLSGERKISYEYFEKLLKFFDVSNYTELINKVLEFFEIESIKELDNIEVTPNSNLHKYDISFLRMYLVEKEIPREELELLFGVNTSTVDAYLHGKIFINENKLNLLLKYFNVSSYENLKQMVLDEFEINNIEELESISNDVYDITFLNEYITRKNINRTKLAEVIGITSNMLYRYLYLGLLIPKFRLLRLLKYFECESYEDLKEKVEKELNPNITMDLKVDSISKHVLNCLLVDNMYNKKYTDEMIANIFNIDIIEFLNYKLEFLHEYYENESLEINKKLNLKNEEKIN